MRRTSTYRKTAAERTLSVPVIRRGEWAFLALLLVAYSAFAAFTLWSLFQ
jgi:hypothetical protein